MSGPLQLPPIPESLKSIQHFFNIAADHETRDPVVTYWCRLYGLQKALKVDKASDGAKLLLLKLMDWLEQEKKIHRDNDAIMNDTAAQAHLENYALQIFHWADSMDRAGTFNKNVVKAFYTAGILMEVLDTFGELSEEFTQYKKYAKWKAAYIHNCLKNGETPIPGPAASGDGANPTPPSSQNTEAGSSGLPSNSADNIPKPLSFTPVTPPEGGGSFPSSTSQPNIPPLMGFDPLTPSQPPTPTFPKPSQPTPTSFPAPVTPIVPQCSNDQQVSHIAAEEIKKCQKYIKFAGSALNYDDYTEAKLNLIKALNILNTGREA